MARRTPVAVETEPDVIGVNGRAQVAAGLLDELQRQQEEIRLIQESLEAGDDALIPPPKGRGDTFAERKTALTDAKKNLLAATEPEVLEVLRKATASN